MARRQNPKIERTLKRTSSLKLVKQTFLIVCEDIKDSYTEAATLRCLPICLVSDMARQKGTP